MRTFQNWCALNDVQPLPAAPADIAKFVSDCAELGMEEIWPILQEISRAHYLIGLADPTLGGPVSSAVCGVELIDPPRSWPAKMKDRFHTLPYDIRAYLSEHEVMRDKEVRRAQTEADVARKQLATLQSPVATILKQRKRTNGNSTHAPA